MRAASVLNTCVLPRLLLGPRGGMHKSLQRESGGSMHREFFDLLGTFDR